jgi:hypothetical protein
MYTFEWYHNVASSSAEPSILSLVGVACRVLRLALQYNHWPGIVIVGFRGEGSLIQSHGTKIRLVVGFFQAIQASSTGAFEVILGQNTGLVSS